jgi:hypothetical protein
VILFFFMFWKLSNAQSGLDALLEKDDPPLLEILDQEEVIQQCKGHHKKLIE